jgi:hypothetical protein
MVLVPDRSVSARLLTGRPRKVHQLAVVGSWSSGGKCLGSSPTPSMAKRDNPRSLLAVHHHHLEDLSQASARELTSANVHVRREALQLEWRWETFVAVLSQQFGAAEGKPCPGGAGEGGSSPDKAGTCQYCRRYVKTDPVTAVEN